jgi:hypothetical protein
MGISTDWYLEEAYYRGLDRDIDYEQNQWQEEGEEPTIEKTLPLSESEHEAWAAAVDAEFDSPITDVSPKPFPSKLMKKPKVRIGKRHY